YYGGGDLTAYRTESGILDLEKDVYVLELSGKTFCVYDRVTDTQISSNISGGTTNAQTADNISGENTDTKVTSKVLGIREGKIVNYFMDYKTVWENETYIDGRVADFRENSVDVVTYKHVAERTDTEETYCAMTEYFYYNERKDIFERYPVYALKKEAVFAMEGSEEEIYRFWGSFAGDADGFSYAECDGKVIMMGYSRYQEDSRTVYRYGVYEYDKKENRLGKCILSGNGNYENLDADSAKEVETYERDKSNAVYALLTEYEKGITNTSDGTVLEHREWIGEDAAYIRTSEWTKDNELLMYITKVPFVYENGRAYHAGEGPVRVTYDKITNKEEFDWVYTDHYYDDVRIPDLFCYNIQEMIAEQNLERYMDPQSAFYAYFHVSGGQMKKMTVRNNFGLEIVGIQYEFADGEVLSVDLYRDYQGVYAVYAGGPRIGYETNQWYAMCTEEDWENAVPVEEFSYEMLRDNKSLILKKQLAPNVELYSNANGYGTVLKDGGRTRLLPFAYDLQVSPQFFTGDYDNDGVSEYCVINCVGRGTGYYQDEVSIIDSINRLYDRVYPFDRSDAVAMIDKNLRIWYNEDKTQIYISLGKYDKVAFSTYVRMDDGGTRAKMGKITYGDICYMTCENGLINCDVLLQYVPYDWVTGVALSELDSASRTSVWDWVHLQVRYAGNGEFVLENISLASDEEVGR
ncbi:MAG: hypothetical protein NC086_09140, partial [Alistipes sp.]|nr:hypothetical protein [Alistipes sp.]